EGGEMVEVAEVDQAGAGDVGGGDLGALEEGNLAAVIYGDVSEGLPAGEQASEYRGRAGSGVEDGGEAAAMVAGDAGCDVAQRRREVGHQRVAGVLAEGGGNLRCVDHLQLGGRPRSGGAEALGHPGGDREVAAPPRSLADRRPPARAEVDRVETDDEGG